MKYNALLLLAALVLTGQGCFQSTGEPAPADNATPPTNTQEAPPSAQEPPPPTSQEGGGTDQGDAPVTDEEPALSDPSQGY